MVLILRPQSSLALIALVAASTAFGGNPHPRNLKDSDHSRYSRLFPTHVEYCSGGQYEMIDGLRGIGAGHAFSYIQGLCKDGSKTYPQVKICDGSEDHQGVGISSNRDFRNVKWVAVPSYSLLMDGGVHEGESISTSTLDQVIDRATQARVFEGVVVQPELANDRAGNALLVHSLNYQDQAARGSIGTDIGLRLARNLECVRLPFLKERLQAVADRLNDINNSYYKTGIPYVWDVTSDNCTHLSRSILDAAGLHEASSLGTIRNISLPRNGGYSLVQAGILRSLDPGAVYAREQDRNAILSGSPWLPTQVGVIANYIPGFSNNSVFKLTRGYWRVPLADLKKYQTAIAAFESPSPNYSEIGANLQEWELRYSRVLARTRAKAAQHRDSDYQYFRSKYEKYLSEKQDEVREKRAIYDRILSVHLDLEK